LTRQKGIAANPSDAGLPAGNVNPTPGEISPAHHGLLFLDELPEFKRNLLETLRQPVETCQLTGQVFDTTASTLASKIPPDDPASGVAALTRISVSGQCYS
jgi:hypothetical protein